MKPFSQIIGQEKAVGFLKKVIKGERIPHAYLFTGINGVGKSTTALALARAINCSTDISDEGCGNCITCRQLTSGNFPDFITIAPDGQNIRIEQIRELNRNLNFKPVSGKYRIILIDKAEMMTEEAANSFLKTLEEPPPGNIIVLKVVDPLDLLSTIISRCQKIPFHPLTHNVIKNYLVEQLGQDNDTAWIAAGISEGSLGRAVKICEEGFLNERKELLNNIMKLQEMSSVQVLDMAVEYSKKYLKKAQEDESNMDLYELTGIWKTCYRDMLLLKVHGNYEMLVNRDYSESFKKLSERYDADSLIESIFLIDGYQRDLQKNPNTGLMMENILLELKALNKIN